MSKYKFKVDDYVDWHYRFEKENSFNVEEFDRFETQKDTCHRNVRNLLKNFDKDFNIKNFKFNNNIFNFFPLHQLEKEQAYEFIEHLLNLKGLVGNKLISNMQKINIDNVEVRDFYIKQPVISEFQNLHEEFKAPYQEIIRRDITKANSIIENFSNTIKELKANNNPSDLGKVSSLATTILLQMVNYWVITTQSIPKDTKLEHIKQVQAYLTNFDAKVDSIELNKNMELSDAIIIFIEFLRSYNYCGEYINIASKLIQEELDSPEVFSDVKDEFKAKKRTSYKDFNYKEIMTEGTKVYDFKDKFTKTQKAIEIFQNNGVKASDISDMFDLKVYFREIYMSNCKYKTKASTIIRKMTESSISEFEKNSEYMFLREKITRGCFREIFPLELYHYKINLQEHIYQIILKNMLSYDYNKSLDNLQKFIADMTPLCFASIDDIYEKTGKVRVFDSKR